MGKSYYFLPMWWQVMTLTTHTLQLLLKISLKSKASELLKKVNYYSKVYLMTLNLWEEEIIQL
jgi:hypothetical protein